MKKIVLMFVVFLFSFGVSFADINIKQKNELDKSFSDKVFYWLQNTTLWWWNANTIKSWKENILKLEKYWNDYDNSKYYIAMNSLYIAYAYSGYNPYFEEKNEEEYKYYLKKYQNNKNVKLKRLTSLTIDTNLSLELQEYIEEYVNMKIRITNEKLNKYTTYDKIYFWQSIIKNTKEKKLEEKNSLKYFVYSYIDYLAQEYLYDIIVNSFLNWEYENTIEYIIDSISSFGIDSKTFPYYKINEKYSYLLDILFMSYYKYIELTNSKEEKVNIAKEALNTLNNKKIFTNELIIESDNKDYFDLPWYHDYHHYLSKFSCVLKDYEDGYKNNCEKYKNSFLRRWWVFLWITN